MTMGESLSPPGLLARNRWWETFSVVYQGKVWDLLEDVDSMDLRSNSRVYLVPAGFAAWPRGPNQLQTFEWEGQQPHFVMSALGKLLSDHASPFEFTMSGLYLAASQLVVPEEEWKGTCKTHTFSH